METTKMITGIYAIAATPNPEISAFELIKTITHQLGLFHCDVCNDAAACSYEGIISCIHKEKLQDIARKNDYVLMFVEAEAETPWINCEVIHIPTNKEMKEHLEWE